MSEIYGMGVDIYSVKANGFSPRVELLHIFFQPKRKRFARWFQQSSTTPCTSSGSISIINLAVLGQSRGNGSLVSIQDDHLTRRHRRCVSTVPQGTETLTALVQHVIVRQYPHPFRVAVIAKLYTAANSTSMEVSARLGVNNSRIPTYYLE